MLPVIMHCLLVLADAAKTNSRLLKHLFTERKEKIMHQAFEACLNIKLMLGTQDVNPFYGCIVSPPKKKKKPASSIIPLSIK